jgi:hypothetical protein
MQLRAWLSASAKPLILPNRGDGPMRKLLFFLKLLGVIETQG